LVWIVAILLIEPNGIHPSTETPQKNLSRQKDTYSNWHGRNDTYMSTKTAGKSSTEQYDPHA
jgi:hypothetical protein